MSNADATKIVGIQVKANSGSKPHWLLSDKIEHDVAENLFYVFVNLNGIDAPDYYIVPRSVVSKTVSENHGIFLKTTRKDGTDHNLTPMRSFQFAGDVRKPYSYPDSALYKNDEGWKLLGLELGVNS